MTNNAGNYSQCAYCGNLCGGGYCSQTCAQQATWELNQWAEWDELMAGAEDAIVADDTEPRAYEGEEGDND